MAPSQQSVLISSQSYHPPKPKPLTKDERIQVAHFRSLRNSIHEGPLYTVLGDNVRVGKTGYTPTAANFDPFEGMPTYSKKYTKQRRRIPKLDTRPYGRHSDLRSYTPAY